MPILKESMCIRYKIYTSIKPLTLYFSQVASIGSGWKYLWLHIESPLKKLYKYNRFEIIIYTLNLHFIQTAL